MKKNVSSIYLNAIKRGGIVYARKRARKFKSEKYKRVFNSTYSVYFNIAIFLYLRLNSITKNRINFNYNRISSFTLKKFSCKLYKSILNDLERNKIIVINNHYSNRSKSSFSKSYLIHRNLINKINEAKFKFKHNYKEIDIPEKVLKIAKFFEDEDKFGIKKFLSSSLNTYYGNNHNIEILDNENFYSKLTFNMEDLKKYCKRDEFMLIVYKMKLKRLNLDPKIIKGRYYHVFHEFSKSFRENVLRLDGKHIKEIYDVKASDLHMLAKILENKNIPVSELLKFQKAVKFDFRKLFGTTKKGKCNFYVKKAFKVYLNSKQSSYNSFRCNSIVRRIDDYFQLHFPTIREYIVKTDNIWLDTMNLEFDVISRNMFERLKQMNIKSLTCHDAVYTKTSDKVQNIDDIFYKSLGLTIDKMNELENL